MSAVTLDGRLYMIEQEHSFKGEDAVRLLKHLMRHIPGKLLLVWDGSPIHRGRAVKDFLSSGAASRVQLERVPGYAPDLNPERRDLEAPQVCGVEQLLLPESRAVEGRATQGQGALET